MPVDLPPPVIITTTSAPATEVAAGEVYGPVDTEQAEQPGSDGAKQSAPDCPQVSDDVIVVCASTDPGQHRLGKLAPPGATAWDDLDAATTIRLGPAEIQPQVMDGESASPIPRKGIGIGMRIRF